MSADIYVSGYPPRPDILIDAMLELRQEVSLCPIGPDEAAAITVRKEVVLIAPTTHKLKRPMR